MPQSTRYEFFNIQRIQSLSHDTRRVIVQFLLECVAEHTILSQGIRTVTTLTAALLDESAMLAHAPKFDYSQDEDVDLNQPEGVQLSEDDRYKLALRLPSGQMLIRLPYQATDSCMKLLNGVKRIDLPFNPNARYRGVSYSARDLLDDQTIAAIKSIVL